MGEPKGFLVVPIGYNPSDDLRSLELDANDNLKVVIAAAFPAGDNNIGNVDLASAIPAGSARIGSAGGEGWIGGAWQKQAIAPWYSGTIAQTLGSSNLAAGFNQFNGSAVPAGELWVLQVVSMYTDSASVTTLIGQLIDPSGTPSLMDQRTIAANQRYIVYPHVFLTAGGNVRFLVDGATLGDDAFLDVLGYRVDLDQ